MRQIEEEKKAAVFCRNGLLICIIPLAKNGAADTNHRAAFFNGDFVIIGHAHGNFFERILICEKFFFQKMEIIMQLVKFMVDLSLVVSQAGHAHNAANFNIFQLTEPRVLEHFQTFVHRETKFRFFRCHMKLQQTTNDALMFLCQFIDFHQQFEAIDAVNQMYKRNDVFDFVRL